MRDPTVNVATNVTTENVDKLSHPDTRLCCDKLSEASPGDMVSHSLDAHSRGIILEKTSASEVKVLWSRMPVTREYDNHAFMKNLLKKVKEGDIDLKNYEIKNAKLSKGIARLSVNVVTAPEKTNFRIRFDL